MRADYLSFARATSRSLLGLAIQLVLGLVLLVYGLYGRDPAAVTASIFILCGVPVWLTLAVLYDQHRRERIESIEAENFAASDAASSSVFEQSDDLRVAAKRLRAMYRVMVPVVSLSVGAALVLAGVLRFRAAKDALETYGRVPAELSGMLQTNADLRGWGVAAGVAVAFVGFLFARYISGMSKEKVWSNLRGGAGFAVGSALLGLSLAVSHFAIMAGASQVLVLYMALVFPVIVVALGGEIFLNFLFELYRPRKPGEMPRPAFESWILGLVAAPDRIAQRVGEALNYQFGYDVSSGWFYQLLSRTALRVLLPVALLVVWGMTALVVVRPHERGMVLRWGQFSRVIDPGLHFKYPWPIETVEVPQYVRRDAQGRVEFSSRTVTGVRSVDVGTPPPASDQPILWTNEHAPEEVFFLVQPERLSRSRSWAAAAAGTMEEPERRSTDLALVAAEVPLHYAVDDVRAYEELAPPGMRDELLRGVAQRAVMQYLSTRTVGELLAGDRSALQEQVRRRVEEAFIAVNPLKTGRPVVQVLYVGLQGLHPPKAAVTQFEQVVTSEQKYNARLKEAEGNAIRTLTMAVGSVELANDIVRELDRLESMPPLVGGEVNPALKEQQLKVRTLIEQAGGRAASIILEASADRWQQHMGERARLASYQGQLASYRAAPAVYRAGLYLEALKEAIAESRVYIVDPSANLNVRPNLEDRDSVGDIFRSQTD
jgi:modulator of FtsH protease HflK